MGAFKTDPLNRKLRVNYDAMMLHFFGRNQNLIDGEVNRRMRILAERDHEEKMVQQQRIDLLNHKIECASSIQVIATFSSVDSPSEMVSASSRFVQVSCDCRQVATKEESGHLAVSV
jgi:hypothetical protein